MPLSKNTLQFICTELIYPITNLTKAQALVWYNPYITTAYIIGGQV